MKVLRTIAVAVAATLSFAFFSAHAQVQTAASPQPVAAFAGSYHGFGKQTGSEMVFVIEDNARWTVATRGRGKATDTGVIKNGAFKMSLPQGSGTITVTKTGPDAILATIQWYSGSKWIMGETLATRCAKPDCTDKARGGHNLIVNPNQQAP